MKCINMMLNVGYRLNRVGVVGHGTRHVCPGATAPSAAIPKYMRIGDTGILLPMSGGSARKSVG
jgi:hypothetical protein